MKMEWELSIQLSIYIYTYRYSLIKIEIKSSIKTQEYNINSYNYMSANFIQALKCNAIIWSLYSIYNILTYTKPLYSIISLIFSFTLSIYVLNIFVYNYNDLQCIIFYFNHRLPKINYL